MFAHLVTVTAQASPFTEDLTSELWIFGAFCSSDPQRIPNAFGSTAMFDIFCAGFPIEYGLQRQGAGSRVLDFGKSQGRNQGQYRHAKCS